MFFDPLYLLIGLVGLVLGIGAQLLVKGAFAKYSRVRASSGVTGAQAAQIMLDHAGLGSTVRIERVGGHLSDHYDPRTKVVRLSPDVYDGRSLASLGVACHEVGHAIQHARRYAPLGIRNAAVPVASFGSGAAIIFLMIGTMLVAMGSVGLGQTVGVVGLLLFGAIVFFQLVNLPVEFDASARAKELLPALGLINGRQEQAGVAKVLNAAALTYVAATAVAIMQLLYWAFRLGLLGGGRRD